MADLGKFLILAGGFLLIVGIVFVLSDRMHVPIGRLPGDIVYRGKNTTVYVPIVTSIALSAVLSLVMYLVGRFRH
jgi:hypothetical protein